MLPVPPPEPLPRARDRSATRPAAGPVAPPAAVRRAGEQGAASVPAAIEPVVHPKPDAPAGSPGSRAPTAAALSTVRPVAGPGSASLSLSEAARALAALAAMDSSAPPGAATVRIDAPLVSRAPDASGVRQLAASIARAVERSGLFYEAHQAQWVAGERRLDELEGEARGRVATTPPDVRSATQLALLDAGVLRLSLEAWAGQAVDLEIVDPRHRAAGEVERDDSWRTRLTVVTPALGTIVATFALRAGALSIAFAAEAHRVRHDLARALPRLREALAAHELATTSLMVADDHG